MAPAGGEDFTYRVCHCVGATDGVCCQDRYRPLPRPGDVWAVDTTPTIVRIPAQCPDCQTWFVNEHRCPQGYVTTTTSISSGTTSPAPEWLRDAKVTNTTA